MIQALTRLVLERPGDGDSPIDLGTARMVRMVTFFVIIPIAAVAVLVGGLAPSAAVGARKNMEILRESFLAFAHICYLCLAFWDLVLARPIYRIYRQTLVFPGLVFLGYVLFAVSTFETHELLGPLNAGSLLKFLSYLCFFVLYAWWAIRDVLEWRAIYTKRAEKFMWWLVELVSMAILAVGMAWMLPLHKPETSLPLYGNKDVAIIFTLVFWSIITAVAHFVRGENLHRVYNDYLKNVEVSGDVSLPRIQLPANGKVLDVGSADGRRLCEILKWLGLQQGPLEIVGFDRDEGDREPFIRHLKDFLPDSPVRFKTDVTDERGFNLVVFSHFIYTLSGVSKAINILSYCDPGTYVVVRGSSPNSVFQAVSRAHSLRLFSPTYGHAWTGSALPRLVLRSNLRRFDASKRLSGEMAPDAMVKQSYNLSKGDEPVAAIADFLGYLYGGTVREEVREYFQSLAEIKRDQPVLLPNDDVIFVFVKGAPSEQGGGQTTEGTIPAREGISDRAAPAQGGHAGPPLQDQASGRGRA